MMNLNWRRFRHHWQTALAMMLYLALAAALVASTSDFAAAISARELNRDLEKAGPADRTLLITGTRYTFRDALYEDLEESLGDVLKARLVIRHSSLPADPRPSSLEARSVPDLTRLEVYALDPLRENVRVVQGRLPAEVRMADAVGNWPPAMEAVIGARAAGQTGYQVGGTSPFATRKTLPVYMEKTIQDLQTIYINGGKRGFLVEMSPRDMINILTPTVVEIGIKSG
jgi:hypothetical protein